MHSSISDESDFRITLHEGLVRDARQPDVAIAGARWKWRAVESMESQKTGFPPLLEIPTGFPHSQRFDGDEIS